MNKRKYLAWGLTITLVLVLGFFAALKILKFGADSVIVPTHQDHPYLYFNDTEIPQLQAKAGLYKGADPDLIRENAEAMVNNNYGFKSYDLATNPISTPGNVNSSGSIKSLADSAVISITAGTDSFSSGGCKPYILSSTGPDPNISCQWNTSALGVRQQIYDLSFAYVLTNNPDYLVPLKTIIEDVSAWDRWSSTKGEDNSYTDNSTGYIANSFIFAYDSLYGVIDFSGLTSFYGDPPIETPILQVIQRALYDKAISQYNLEFNSSSQTLKNMILKPETNNPIESASTFGLASLALLNDIPQGTAQDNDLSIINPAETNKVLRAELQGYLDSAIGGSDTGCNHYINFQNTHLALAEGLSYGGGTGTIGMSSLINFIVPLKEVADHENKPAADLITPNTNLLTSVFAGPLYLTQGKNMIDFNDEDAGNYFWDFNLAYSANKMKNPDSAWFLKRYGYNYSSANQVMEFIWLDNKADIGDPPSHLGSPSKILDSDVAMKDGWDLADSDVNPALYFRSGFQAGSHTHYDQNTFSIQTDSGCLVCDSGYTGFQTKGGSTVAHNTLLFDNTGGINEPFDLTVNPPDKPYPIDLQTGDQTNYLGGYIDPADFFTSQNLDYVKGSAASAYGYVFTVDSSVAAKVGAIYTTGNSPNQQTFTVLATKYTTIGTQLVASGTGAPTGSVLALTSKPTMGDSPITFSAYSAPPTKFDRSIFYLKPNYFVVFDDLGSDGANHKYDLLFGGSPLATPDENTPRSVGNPSLVDDNKNYKFINNSGSEGLVGSTISTVDYTQSVKEGEGATANSALNLVGLGYKNLIDVQANTSNPNPQFLSIFHPYKTSATPDPYFQVTQLLDTATPPVNTTAEEIKTSSSQATPDLLIINNNTPSAGSLPAKTVTTSSLGDATCDGLLCYSGGDGSLSLKSGKTITIGGVTVFSSPNNMDIGLDGNSQANLFSGEYSAADDNLVKMQWSSDLPEVTVNTNGSFVSADQITLSSNQLQFLLPAGQRNKIIIGHDTTPPAVSLDIATGGGVGGAGTIGGQTTLNVKATDNIGVTRIRYYLDGNNDSNEINPSSTYTPSSPLIWNTIGVAEGSHTLYARAYDSSGNNEFSDSTSVTVDNAFDITASTDNYATIDPSGRTDVVLGGTQVYTFHADPGFYISTLVIDGKAQSLTSSTNSYTFSNVTSARTISITTAAIDTCVWTGLGTFPGTNDINWSTSMNWSGNTVPTSACNVIFNGTSAGDSTVDTGFLTTNHIKSLKVDSGYIGTIRNNNNLNDNGDLILSSGTFFPGNIHVGGSVTIAGTNPPVIPSSATGTINLDGTSGTITTNGQSLINLTITSGNYTLLDDMTVTGKMTVSGGTFNTGTHDLTIGSYTQSGGDFNKNNTSTAANISDKGDFSLLANGGTFTSTKGILSVAGNWKIYSGSTFIHNSGTVILTGNAYVLGSTTFNNLTDTAGGTTITVNFNSTLTISGALTITGTENNKITLVSSSTGVRWKIIPTGTNSVSWVTVSDSTSTVPINAINSTEGTSGSTTKWLNPPAAPSQVVIGTIDSTLFTVSWADNSGDESGFNVYTVLGTADCSTAHYDTPDYTTAVNATSQAITGKTINTQYCAKVVATNANGDSGSAYSLPEYTLANTPSMISVSGDYNTTDNYHLDTTINANNNPAGTQYWLQYSTDSTNFYSPSGMAWQTNTNYLFNKDKDNANLLPDTQYWLKVKAKNGDGTETSYSFSSPDVTPPAAPTKLSSSNIVGTGALVSWAAAPDADNYTLSYGTTNAASDTTIPNITSTSKSITGLTAETQYYFKVSSTSNANGTGAYSDPVSFTTIPSSAPLAPTDFNGTAVSTSQINWSWSGSAGSVEGYKVEDSITGTSRSVDLSSDTRSWSEVNGLSANTAYTRNVNVWNAAGNNISNFKTVYTQANPPKTPTVSTVSSVSTKIFIDQNSNPNTTRYAIYWEKKADPSVHGYVKQYDGTTQESEDWQLYADWGGESGFINTALANNTDYTYKVKAQNGDKAETAFSSSANATTLNTYAITANTNGGNGIGTTNATSPADSGSNQDITATPDASSNFIGWTDCDSVTNAVCHLTNITADKKVTATFTLKTYAVTISNDGNGTGTLDQATQIVNYGTNLTIHATAADSSNFTGWTGGATGTGDAVLTNIIADKTVTATFALKTYAVTISNDGNGTGTLDQTTQTVNYGANLTIHATANSGSTFFAWTGCDTVDQTSCTLTNITAAKTVVATFTAIQTPAVDFGSSNSQTGTTATKNVATAQGTVTNSAGLPTTAAVTVTKKDSSTGTATTLSTDTKGTYQVTDTPTADSSYTATSSNQVCRYYWFIGICHLVDGTVPVNLTPGENTLASDLQLKEWIVIVIGGYAIKI